MTKSQGRKTGHPDNLFWIFLGIYVEAPAEKTTTHRVTSP